LVKITNKLDFSTHLTENEVEINICGEIMVSET
jgi:hypothetical protein